MEPITLQRIQKKDLEWARKLRNRNREFFFDDSYISPEQMRIWFADLDYYFCIIYRGERRVGTIAYKYRDGLNMELSNVIIVEGERGKDILEKAIKLLVDPGGLYRLFLEVKPDNERAIRAYEKAGFWAEKVVMRR